MRLGLGLALLWVDDDLVPTLGGLMTGLSCCELLLSEVACVILICKSEGVAAFSAFGLGLIRGDTGLGVRRPPPLVYHRS